MFSVTLYIVMWNMINSIHQQELGGGGNHVDKVKVAVNKVKGKEVTVVTRWRLWG